MLVLGILLTAAALVVFGFLFFGTRNLPSLQVDLGVLTVELTPLQLYLLGAATLVVLVLGLMVLGIGLRRSRRQRKEVRDLRQAVRDRGLDPDHPREPAARVEPTTPVSTRDESATGTRTAPPPRDTERPAGVALPTDEPDYRPGPVTPGDETRYPPEEPRR